MNTHRLFAAKGGKLLFFLAASLMLSVSAFASHFRYGNISWKETGTNTIQFQISQAWRTDYAGYWFVPNIGDVIDITASGSGAMDFGDGTFASIILIVTAVNNDPNPLLAWFYGTATITHTYAAAGNYLASFESCCRISSLFNNPDGEFRVQTLVNAGSGNSSPVSTVTPIIDLPLNSASASFQIPAVDPNGQPLSFRLANASEAAGGFFYEQPAGIAVDAATGVVTLPTTGYYDGALLTTQIIISDGTSETAVDFIIRTTSAPPGNPPQFDYTVTPPNASTLTVGVGASLSFDVKATDSDSGDMVTLSAVGIPVGASTTPALPTTGNPVQAQFNWTPALTDVGTYIVQFTAADNAGGTAVTNVTIVVQTSACDPNFAASIKVSPKSGVKGQQPNTIYLGYGLQSLTLTAAATGGGGSYTYDWGAYGSTQAIVASPLTTTGYTVTVTDGSGCTANADITINVVDVRCGPNGNKVLVCYKGCKTICVPKSSVCKLLEAGNTLGSCSSAAMSNTALSSVVSNNSVQDAKTLLKVYPNPAKTQINIDLQGKASATGELRIIDFSGKAVMNISYTGQSMKTIDVSRLNNGIYTLQFITSGKIEANTKILISK